MQGTRKNTELLGIPTAQKLPQIWFPKFIKLTNSKSKIKYYPLPLDDPFQRRPDINLAKQKLNWEPIVNLDEGLIKTIAWYLENKEWMDNVTSGDYQNYYKQQYS